MKTISTLRRALLAAVICTALPAAAAESGYLDIGDDSLYYEVTGQGFPLVLLGGGSGMGFEQWERVIPQLAENYQVIAYDPRGIGRSDNPTARYSDAGDFRQLLDHLELDRVVLFGLSSSGGMVLEFATEAPARIVAVVAAAPFVPGFEFSADMLARLDRFNNAAQQGREPFLNAMLGDPHFIPAPLNKSVRPVARRRMGENYDKGAGFDPSLLELPDPPVIEKLAMIEAPVLLLAGDLDHPEVLRRNAYLAERIARSTVDVIPRAGHNVHLENPDIFLDKASGFLGQTIP